MNIISTYFKGLRKTFTSLKMSVILYFILFFIALTVTLPFRSVLSGSVDHALYPSVLLHNFNFTVFEDFIRNYGKPLKAFLPIMFWVGISYFVFNIFLTGGILNILNNRKGKYSTVYFFEGSGKYFFRFLRLSGINLIVNIIIAVIVYVPQGLILNRFSGTNGNEKQTFYILFTAVVIHIALIILSLIVSDYTKIKLVTNETTKVLRTYWKAVKFTLKNFFSTYILYFLLLLFPLIVSVVYYFTQSSVKMNSAKTILTMFLIHQIFIWTKQFSKIWFYAAQLYMHKKIIPDIHVTPSEKNMEWDLKKMKDDILDNDLIA